MNHSIESAFQSVEGLKPYRNEEPFERFSSETWNAVDEEIPGYGPQWYRDLLQRFSVGGACLHYPIDPERSYMGVCNLLRPKDFIDEVRTKWPMEELFSFGYFAFADGEDGCVWLFLQSSADDPKVLFLEMSSWGGSEPTLSNGLLDPGLTMSELLSKCVVLANSGAEQDTP